MSNMKVLSWNDSISPKEKWVACRIALVVEHEMQKIEIYVPPKVCGWEVMYCNTYVPYGGKLWRALNLANQSPERIGEF